jgi:hypothetical protein
MSNLCQPCYPDRDADGFGDKWATPITPKCGPCAAGNSANNRDCMDNPAVYSAANMVNPNADFHYITQMPVNLHMYATDPRDPSPDGWDWDCDDRRALEFGSRSAGCLSTACTSGCLTAMMTLGPETCGGWVQNDVCDNGCMSGTAELLCVSRTTSYVPQGCK